MRRPTVPTCALHCARLLSILLACATFATTGARPAHASAEAARTATPPSSTDPRVAYWIDPRMTFRAMANWSPIRQVVRPNGPLADTREPGVPGVGGDFALSRGPDPIDPSKSAFRHRIGRDFPTWDGATYRSEISANWQDDGTNVTRGVDYWMAWAVKLEPETLAAGNGSASILDFHLVGDPGDTQRRSPFSFFVGEGAWSIVVGWNPNRRTLAEDTRYETVWRETAPTTAQWHKFVFRFRLHWDAAQQPYVHVWRAIGDGPLVRIAGREGPNAYHDTPPMVPQKFGLYRWDPWSGTPTRTLFTKGMYVLRDRPGPTPLDEHAMRALLDRI